MLVSVEKREPKGGGGILTFEMLTLNIALRHNIHRNLVELGLQILDLASEVLHSLKGGLLVHVLGGLRHDEVDFLRLTVELGPAELHRRLSFVIQNDGLVTLTRHSVESLSVLRGSEGYLVLVHTSDRVGNSDTLVESSRGNREAHWLDSVEQKL